MNERERGRGRQTDRVNERGMLLHPDVLTKVTLEREREREREKGEGDGQTDRVNERGMLNHPDVQTKVTLEREREGGGRGTDRQTE